MACQGFCSDDTKTFKLNENNVFPSDCRSQGKAPQISKQPEQTAKWGLRQSKQEKRAGGKRGKMGETTAETIYYL